MTSHATSAGARTGQSTATWITSPSLRTFTTMSASPAASACDESTSVAATAARSLMYTRYREIAGRLACGPGGRLTSWVATEETGDDSLRIARSPRLGGSG